MNTEMKILQAAKETFIKYGFHGTRLQQIAEVAGVNKSAIHYYYRTKEKLYSKVISNIVADLPKKKLINDLSVLLFMINEFRSNRKLIEHALREDKNYTNPDELIILIQDSLQLISSTNILNSR